MRKNKIRYLWQNKRAVTVTQLSAHHRSCDWSLIDRFVVICISVWYVDEHRELLSYFRICSKNELATAGEDKFEMADAEVDIVGACWDRVVDDWLRFTRFWSVATPSRFWERVLLKNLRAEADADELALMTLGERLGELVEASVFLAIAAGLFISKARFGIGLDSRSTYWIKSSVKDLFRPLGWPSLCRAPTRPLPAGGEVLRRLENHFDEDSDTLSTCSNSAGVKLSIIALSLRTCLRSCCWLTLM